MAAAAQEIVLLPGLDGTGDLFDPLAARLADEFTVKVVRYPNDPTLGYAGYAELVRTVIGTREVFLLGESFSGPIAVRVATQLGQQIKGLMLAATFLKSPQPRWLIRQGARADPEATPKKIRDAILMGSYGDDELRKKVDQIVRNLSRPVREARLKAIAEVDVRDDFAKLDCPVLALWGARGVIPKWYDAVAIWKEWASDVRGEEIDSGHMLAEEAPEATYQALRNFFA